jgi:Flp pilus assembly protein TadG
MGCFGTFSRMGKWDVTGAPVFIGSVIAQEAKPPRLSKPCVVKRIAPDLGNNGRQHSPLFKNFPKITDNCVLKRPNSAILGRHKSDNEKTGLTDSFWSGTGWKGVEMKQTIELVKRAAPRSSVQSSATDGWLGRFWSEQDGNMSYLALVGSMIMMIFGGIGVDLMHAEMSRTKAQNTLDRAVLAAANLNNTRDAETVVEDYFAAMNMSDQLGTVTAGNSKGSKAVTATANTHIATNFLYLIGMDSLDVNTIATAENAAAPMEISLVLDISGSMAGEKLNELKKGAITFIEGVLGDGGDYSNVTINVIPYNSTVNLGSLLNGRYGLVREHSMSSCAYFDNAAFDTPALDPNQPLGHISHFDPFTGETTKTFVDDGICPSGDKAAIMVHSADVDALTTFINGLEAGGNTAIDLGLKWGLALLDPSAQDVVADLAAEGLAPNAAKYRPAPYEGSTRKFVVLMTDGENTIQYDLKSQYKPADAMSNVWVDDKGNPGQGDHRFSVRIRDYAGDSNDLWYWPKTGTFTTRGPWAWENNGAVPMVNGVVNYASIGSSLALAEACSTYKGGGAHSPSAGLDLTGLSAVTDVTSAATDTIDPITGLDLSDLGTDDCLNAGPVQLTWQELFANIRSSDIYANSWYWAAYMAGKVSENEYLNAFYVFEEQVNGVEADARLSRLCDTVTNKSGSQTETREVEIYTIGVEAPEAGLRAMADCASSDAHYNDVQGNQLVETFTSIGDTLISLRLTR